MIIEKGKFENLYIIFTNIQCILLVYLHKFSSRYCIVIAYNYYIWYYTFKVEGNIMVMNDILFKTQLNYQIETNSDTAPSNDLTFEDVKDIDLHRCLFKD